MNAKKRLLIVGPAETVTIVRNAEMLASRFEVRLVKFRKDTPWSHLASVWRTLRGTLWADITMSHFTTVHAFWAVLFSRVFDRKSVVVVAGFEVAKVPELGYGAMLSPLKGRLVKKTMRLADKVFAVSEFTKTEILKYLDDPDKVRTVYGCNAIDCGHFRMNGKPKRNLVLTAGYLDHGNIKRKGFETFMGAAKAMPETDFVLMGKVLDETGRKLQVQLPKNARLMDDADMRAMYREAKVYCQFSYYESLGVCLIESMACRCVPVVCDRAALPEVVAGAGYRVPYGDVEGAVAAIRLALSADLGDASRARAEFFSTANLAGPFADELRAVLEERP